MKPSVLIFDSGAGGLSIASEIHGLLPTVPIHYLMDDAAFPYGTCHDDWLARRIVSLCTQAQQHIHASILVVACNTASTLALNPLRERLSIPVVGVVPAIKTAAQRTQTGHIGLLATPATITRPYTHQLIHDFASDCDVRLKGSVELVHWAEDRIAGKPVSDALFDHLDQWLMQPHSLDHVVLGCTHFPLLRPELEQLWPDIRWVDSGSAIARRVAYCLEQQQQRLPSAPACTWLWWTSSAQQHWNIQCYLERLGPLQAHTSLSDIIAELG